MRHYVRYYDCQLRLVPLAFTYKDPDKEFIRTSSLLLVITSMLLMIAPYHALLERCPVLIQGHAVSCMLQRNQWTEVEARFELDRHCDSEQARTILNVPSSTVSGGSDTPQELDDRDEQSRPTDAVPLQCCIPAHFAGVGLGDRA